MIAASTLGSYLKEQSLPLDRTDVQIAAMTLDAVLAADKPPLARDLYRYPVPELGEGGSCSLFDTLAEAPHDLAPLFGGESAATTAILRDLDALLESTQLRVEADWLGIYVRVADDAGPRLVKLAYRGVPSRAEFPLTEAFAEVSNNSRVGLTGWGMVIDDVKAWRELGGGYYECDPKVRSEVCLPVLDAEGRVLGIIDAEAFATGFFTAERQAWLVALALVLAGPLAALFPREEADSGEAD